MFDLIFLVLGLGGFAAMAGPDYPSVSAAFGRTAAIFR